MLGVVSDKHRAFDIEREFDPEGWQTGDEIQIMSRHVYERLREMGEIAERLVHEMPPEDYYDEEYDDIDVEVTRARRPRGLFF